MITGRAIQNNTCVSSFPTDPIF